MPLPGATRSRPQLYWENSDRCVYEVIHDVYGGVGLNKGDPACVDFATGETRWKVKAPTGGSAAVLYADGHLLFRYDRGLVALVPADPTAFRIAAQFMPLTGEGPAWAHPVIHQKRLYLRHSDLLACYDLSPAP